MLKLLTILAFITLCTCWSFTAHQLAALFAQQRLNNAATKGVQKYLQAWNGNMSAVSTWADNIRNFPEWKFTSPFHFVNVPDRACDFVQNRDCANLQCITGAIENYTSILRDRDRRTFNDSMNALRFLIHFVADITQPLHVGWTSDRGGNTINVLLLGKRTNLHAAWDRGISDIKISELGGINAYITHLRTKLSGEFSSRISDWLRCPEGPNVVACPRHWASDSVKFACNYAYAGVQPGQELGRDYYERAIKAVDEQILKAGVRLAALLNWIFA